MSSSSNELLSAARALYEAYADGRLERLITSRQAAHLDAPIEALERLGAAIEGVEEGRASDSEIASARDIAESYCGTENDLEVDDDAERSASKEGVWVSAWVWVPADDDEDDDDD